MKNSISLNQLKSQQFHFGTTAEAWRALREMADTLANGEMPSLSTIKWFTEAVQRTQKNDPLQLTREFGFVVMGRRSKVDSQKVAKSVDELVKSGSSIMGACSQVAGEFNCATTTAHHWYRTLILIPRKKVGAK